VPQGLSATQASGGAVNLSWQPSTSSAAGTMRYRVFRDGVAIGSKQTATTYTDHPAAGNRTYQVRAIDAAGYKSALSPGVAVVVEAESSDASAPDTTAPSVPQGLTATALGYRRVALAWQPSTDDSGGTVRYRVIRNRRLVATVTGTSFTDRPRYAGTYSYKLRAVDAAGNRSALSKVVKGSAVKGAVD
jgi:cellulose 1,4-beta-cellobiosidase